MSQKAQDSDNGNGNDTQRFHLNLYHLGMLACFIIGTEGTTVFGQIYTLLTLEYLGVPISLATANGIVGGCSAIFLIPLCGLLMDKGDNPKKRKLVALGVSALVFITAFGVLLAAALIKLKGNDENSDEKSQNVSPMTKSNSSINQTFHDILLFTETQPDSTEHTPWIPITGILGLVAFSLVDLAFDLGNFFSRAFALDHTPPTQHKMILMVVSLLAPAAGAFVSIFGILDFPDFLGGTFNVDGTAATLLFFTVFLAVVVISSTSCTILTGLWVAKTKGFLLQKAQQPSPSNSLNMSLRHDTEPFDKDGNSSKHVDESERTSCRHCTQTYTVIPESASGNGSIGNRWIDSSLEKIRLIAHATRPKKNHEPIYSEIMGVCKVHRTTNFTSTSASEMKDNRDFNSEPTESQGREPYFFSKKLVILIMATYASMFCMVHFSMFSSNALTKGVFHGDPLASRGTKGKDLYTQGLRKSALGGTIFYVSYFITSATNRKLVALVGERAIFFVSHVLHAFTTLVFVFFQKVELYYVSMATFGPFRWALFTIPYMMANEFTNTTMGSDSGDRKRGLSKAGRVVSVISVIGPINYLTSSASMGPLLSFTGNVWLPLIFSCSGGFMSALIFIPLFFMK